MIAMQYSFALSADYDMDIVDRRIRDKGAFTDGFPHLSFKAYLTARKNDPETGSPDNLYAPFYVWDNGEGLNNFVCGTGFAGVSAAFGRPQVKTWISWAVALSADVREARFASREIFDIEPDSDLAKMRAGSARVVKGDIEASGALASVAAFEPTRWTGVRFRLWARLPEAALPNARLYRVGHISLPVKAAE